MAQVQPTSPFFVPLHVYMGLNPPSGLLPPTGPQQHVLSIKVQFVVQSPHVVSVLKSGVVLQKLAPTTHPQLGELPQL